MCHQFFDSVGEICCLGVAEDKAVGSCTAVFNSCPSRMGENIHQIVTEEKWLTSGNRQSLYATFCSTVDNLFTVVKGESAALKIFSNSHGTLGTAGIASVGELNNKLPWGSACKEIFQRFNGLHI